MSKRNLSQGGPVLVRYVGAKFGIQLRNAVLLPSNGQKLRVGCAYKLGKYHRAIWRLHFGDLRFRNRYKARDRRSTGSINSVRLTCVNGLPGHKHNAFRARKTRQTLKNSAHGHKLTYNIVSPSRGELQRELHAESADVDVLGLLPVKLGQAIGNEVPVVTAVIDAYAILRVVAAKRPRDIGCEMERIGLIGVKQPKR